MADETRTVVPASEILEKIHRGDPVEYDNIIVEGDLDLTKLDLPEQQVERTQIEVDDLNLSKTAKIAVSPIKITTSEIRGFVRFNNCVLQKDVNFRGTKFTRGNAIFIGAKFGGDANFIDAKFTGRHADFRCAEFRGNASFIGVHFFINSIANFSDARFTGHYTNFADAKFGGHAGFVRAKFKGYVEFIVTKFTGRRADFSDAEFTGKANFIGAKFTGGIARFCGAKFGDKADFAVAQFLGDVLTFRNAIFADPRSQEDACRRAKNVLERAGDREEAGYHFYREMEGKRKSKGIKYEYFDYEILLSCKLDEKELQAIQSRKLTSLRKYVWYNKIEYFLFQLIFGYGVHPHRLWGWWFFFVFLFAAIYWVGKGVRDATTAQAITDPLAYIWFSITVAVTPGFAGYKPAAGWYQLLAGLEAIFGTFMWAAFITTFARKYMR